MGIAVSELSGRLTYTFYTRQRDLEQHETGKDERRQSA